MPSLDILSWNIKSGGFAGYEPDYQIPVREDAIVSAVRGQAADTVSLVDAHRWGEYYGSDQAIARHLGYRTAHYVDLEDDRLSRDNGEYIGIAFATDLPVEISRPLDLDTRQGLTTILDIGHHGLQLASVYLDDMSERVRRRQIKAMFSNLERDIPTIIVGDFNMLRNTMDGASLSTRSRDLAIHGLSAALRKAKPAAGLTASVTGMNERRAIKLMHDGGFTDADTRKRPTAPAKLPIFGIDYMFHDAAVQAGTVDVIPTTASDHRILKARFTV